MIVSYDVDGVLAEQPPPSAKKWGQMKGEERQARQEFLKNWYHNAKPLLNPKEQHFYAISARKREQIIYNITKHWIKKHHGDRLLGLYLLKESRSIENVVAFKTHIVQQLKIQRHYEDNRKILKGMRKLLSPDIELYFWEKGMTEPIPYKD